ncbi:MAG TPA: 16S rRNA (cytidine(1402)-2'-O)-methyltransferase [Acidimicrobiia bacterium]|nr:16S rRNA (cytidine(1402)-2'-O)-methyltransferase [Acidimicrobiia bacterium]
MPGRLILCATPIGNLGDASLRLAQALNEAEIIFAEDTRRSRVLIQHLGVERPLRSYHAGNEGSQAALMRDLLAGGATVAFLTDAGTPAISDPGMSAVTAARAAAATVSVIPGPSAVTAALAVSGLPSERFTFEGFLPRKGRSRRQRLQELSRETRSMVFFIAPHHLLDDLRDLLQGLGDRPLSVARELTKTFEEVWWGTLAEAIEHWTSREPRGEFTVVIAGGEDPEPDLEVALGVALELIERGAPLATAVKEVAETSGVSRRELYQRVVNSR